ncbi:MAG: SCO family protein [Mariprofundaceae bacterium]
MHKLRPVLLAVLLLFVLSMMQAGTAYAAYGNVSQTSEVDPAVLKIDENAYLGEKIPAEYVLMDAEGQEFRVGDILGKPIILALSYYSCDGACSALNRNLRNTLEGVERWSMGQDYRVLTVSFDQHDTPETMRKFMQQSGFKDGLPEGWRMGTFKDPEDIMRLTESVGFKFFWSPRDRMFLHPSVYIMLSPKGRVTRFLYGSTVSGNDLEISITKALGEKISASNVINFVLGACYSYNYKDGKYAINIPLFVAAGGLFVGVIMIITGATIMKRRRVRDENQIIHA